MYAITGITGKVGGELARALLAAGQPVRAVVRDQAKGATWAAKGCEVALAEMEDTAALTEAFTGAEGVFILPPSDFDPEPGYPAARRVIESVVAALLAARPAKVLCLSTIGADATQDNLLSQRTLMETALRETGLPVTFLRPGWFMENALWDVASARDTGILHSFLQPLDKPFSMVATRDIGELAAQLIRETWDGVRIVELEGPVRVTPLDLGQAFAEALGTPVQVQVVARETWEPMFRGQGMKNPTPRIRMVDGFNEGWISFEGRATVKGRTPLIEVIKGLVRTEA
ncbi:MAG: NmrA family NAD(P)-binding protein [Caulobacteraceae bacterium]